MNFFQAQDDARRKTWQLALLFVAAVASLIIMTNVLIAVVYLWAGNYALPASAPMGQLLAGVSAEYWLLITCGVVGAVGLASVVKYLALRGGGRTVAEALGGQLVHQSTTDPRQRRLLNVVEEMAIASGLPVPPVYLIPQPSINAFAAGFGMDDAVIGINQGTLEHLSRDELQGVVGHELSHVLNGDSRINLRLIAMLHGILFIGMLGYGILRGVGRSRRGSSSGGVPVLALGVGLLVIGYSGTFFGNLIKAAVSRQREYLADAAAVQFTRNPSGIADALKKIGGAAAGSAMTGAAAQEMSHMFFGASSELFLNRLLATHPPLPDRIRAVDPGWDGRFIDVDSAPGPTPIPTTPDEPFLELTDRNQPPIEQPAAPEGTKTPTMQQTSIAELTDAVGDLSDVGLDAAKRMISTITPELQVAAHDPWAGRALIYTMLLDSNAAARAGQLRYLGDAAEPGIAEEAERLQHLVTTLSAPQRLTLQLMATPALKELSDPQYRRFIKNVVEIITADRKIGLLEWVLHRLLMKEVRPHFDGPHRVRARYRSVQELPGASGTVLSAMARYGHPDEPGRQQAFAEGMRTLQMSGQLEVEDDPNFMRLNEALKQLRQLKPLAKPSLLKACAAVALADGAVSAHQSALVQGIAATLDCPLPPSIHHD